MCVTLTSKVTGHFKSEGLQPLGKQEESQCLDSKCPKWHVLLLKLYWISCWTIVCCRHSLNTGFVCMNEHLFYKTHSCFYFILKVARQNVSQGPESRLLTSCSLILMQMHGGWSSVESMWRACMCVPLCTCTRVYGSVLERRGESTANCAKNASHQLSVRIS